MLHLASSTPSTTATLHVVSHLHCDGGSGISGSHHAESGSGAPRSAAQGRVTATVTTRTKVFVMYTCTMLWVLISNFRGMLKKIESNNFRVF